MMLSWSEKRATLLLISVLTSEGASKHKFFFYSENNAFYDESVFM
jgi:hypothetical protein